MILHITTDNKFIHQALQTFENVYSGKNEVWMIGNAYDGHDKTNSANKTLKIKDIFNPKVLKEISKYEIVIIHSFYWLAYPLIALAPSNVKYAWIGWGYDYYEFIYPLEDQLLLNKTLRIKKEITSKDALRNINLKSVSKRIIKKIIISIFKKKAIRKIDSISPVLINEYEMLKANFITKDIPKLIPWNYGSLEENLVKNFLNDRISGSKVLIGNSGTYTNNHIEVFDMLGATINLKKIDVIVPLSYGEKDYIDYIEKEGEKYFKSNFLPLKEFLSIEEYVNLIKQCGNVIMNHKRQQAVSNIVIMIYLGARLFLRDDNPTFKMLKSEGACINSISDLIENKELLDTPLNFEEIKRNQIILKKHWSKTSIDLKTKALIEYHLGLQKKYEYKK